MDFFLSKNMLDEIGQYMQNSWPEIPTALGQTPRNIFKHAKSFKAKEWQFWLYHYALTILQGQLLSKYLKNFHQLSQIYEFSE